MFTTKLVVLVLLVALIGCAGSSRYMKMAPSNASYGPKPGKALIVFMRPSGFAYAIDAGVLHVLPDSNKMVGIVSAKKKVAYSIEPGEHLFMVVGEAADFLKAHVEAEKTYYVNVKVRSGVWKARFSLVPIRTDEFEKWSKGTRYVENTELSHQWEIDNRSDIESKRNKYYIKWTSKSEAFRQEATLFAEDGH